MRGGTVGEQDSQHDDPTRHARQLPRRVTFARGTGDLSLFQSHAPTPLRPTQACNSPRHSTRLEAAKAPADLNGRPPPKRGKRHVAALGSVQGGTSGRHCPSFGPPFVAFPLPVQIPMGALDVGPQSPDLSILSGNPYEATGRNPMPHNGLCLR